MEKQKEAIGEAGGKRQDGVGRDAGREPEMDGWMEGRKGREGKCRGTQGREGGRGAMRGLSGSSKYLYCSMIRGRVKEREGERKRKGEI